MSNNEVARPYMRTLPMSEVSAPAMREQELLAELRSMQRRGEIHSIGNKRYGQEGGQAVVRVDFVRIAEPAPKWKWYAAGVSLTMGGLVGIGIMLWETRWIWLTLAAITAGSWLAIKLACVFSSSNGPEGCTCVIHGARCPR